MAVPARNVDDSPPYHPIVSAQFQSHSKYQIPRSQNLCTAMRNCRGFAHPAAP
jgi:hypothetical protein